jgi:hypothetical protein
VRKYLVRALFGGVAVGWFISVSAFPASAGPYTLADNYNGGIVTYGDMTGDTIEDPGTHNFEITSAIISRSGIGNDTLNITINTNFAGVPGTAAADGTGYGSLFLTPGTWTSHDTYSPNQWQYAVLTTQNPGPGSIGTTTTGLYAIGGDATANPYGPNPAVPVSYTTDNGKIFMSNVNGDPVTYPYSGSPPYYFRQGQAVQYVPGQNQATVAGTAATWAVNAALHTITYTIVDNGLFGDSFALAWAMTCANDVIQGQVSLTEGEGIQSSPTPLPAGFLLMGSVLGGGGLVARWRLRRRGGHAPAHATAAA